MIKPTLLVGELFDRLGNAAEAARGERFEFVPLARRRAVERHGEGVGRTS